MHQKKRLTALFQQSDDALPAGGIQLPFPERTDLVRIPGKAIQRHAYPVFSKEIGDILEKDIQMTRKEPGLGTRGLAQQIIDTPYPDWIIAVKGERGRIGCYAGAPQVTGGIAEPA